MDAFIGEELANVLVLLFLSLTAGRPSGRLRFDADKGVDIGLVESTAPLVIVPNLKKVL